jgi:hypothetical protein
VVDAGDRAVAGADAAFRWHMDGEAAEPDDAVPTDGDGRFVLRGVVQDLPTAVMVMDADRRRGAALVLDRGALLLVQRFRLAPLSRLRGQLQSRDVEGGLTDIRVSVALDGIEILHADLPSPRFSLLLPPGEYELVAESRETMAARRPITIEEAQDLDVGAVDLVPTLLGSSYSHAAPPLSVVPAKGGRSDWTWESFRGRWVVVLFWNLSDTTTTRGGFPRAMALVERHAANRERFEILAIHDQSVTTVEEMEAGLKALIEDAWGGKEPPFPILLDPGGETARRYDVDEVPAEYLVDPEGRLQRGGLDELDALLTEEDPEVDEIQAALKRAVAPATIGPLLDRLAAKKTRRSAQGLLEYADKARGDAFSLVLMALARHGRPECIEYLTGPKALQSKIPSAQDAAIEAAEASKDPAVVDPLVSVALGAKSRAKAVAAALRALGSLAPNDERIWARSMDLSKSPFPEVRAAALPYVARLRSLDAMQRLAFLLGEDTVAAVREEAAVALGALGRKDAKPFLEKAVKDDGVKKVREAAGRALEALEDPK